MKRTQEMNKYYKEMLNDLDEILGEADAYLIILILRRALKKAIGQNDMVQLNTFAISFNDEEPIEWDFITGDFIEKEDK